jgi:hypothetical protein
MPACTSSPINGYSWRNEVESRSLILDSGLCQMITDAYQQIANIFLKWWVSLTSSYIGVSWSSCYFTSGWIPSYIHLFATDQPQLEV